MRQSEARPAIVGPDVRLAIDQLLALAEGAVGSNPEQALAYAGTARTVAATGGRAALEALSLGVAAWATSRLGDLRGATQLWQQAELLRIDSEVEPELERRFCYLHYHVLMGCNLYGESIAAATELLRSARDESEKAEALFLSGSALGANGDLQQAIRQGREAHRRLCPKSQRGLIVSNLHNLALFRLRLGHHAAALNYLLRGGAYRAEMTPVQRCSFMWTEGLARKAAGEIDHAERLLDRAGQDLLRMGMLYKSARAYLDLAALYAGTGRILAIGKLSIELTKTFSDAGFAPEALVAFKLLRSHGSALGAVTKAIDIIEQQVRAPRMAAPGPVPGEATRRRA